MALLSYDAAGKTKSDFIAFLNRNIVAGVLDQDTPWYMFVRMRDTYNHTINTKGAIEFLKQSRWTAAIFMDKVRVPDPSLDVVVLRNDPQSMTAYQAVMHTLPLYLRGQGGIVYTYDQTTPHHGNIEWQHIRVLGLKILKNSEAYLSCLKTVEFWQVPQECGSGWVVVFDVSSAHGNLTNRI